MKRFFVFAFAAFALLAYNSTMAQISHGGEPYFNSSNSKFKTALHEMPPINNEKYLQEDMKQTKGAGPMRIGVMQDCEIDLVKSATCIKDAEGSHYLLAISSPNASFISLHFSTFNISNGSQLFFYDQSGDVVLGSFIDSDVLEDGTFYTQSIPGNVIYVEYNVPQGIEAGRLVIDKVSHGYKDIFAIISRTYEDAEWSMKGQLGSAEGNCHIDVECPEGDDWRDQIRSVVALELNDGMYIYMCSGAVINNARQDHTPYVLSAYHCQELDNGLHGVTTYFHYQARTCNGSTGFPTNKSITGATIKAKYSYQSGSDFLLLRLSGNIPDNYEPYYSGWDRTVANSTSVGACIHHPGGDWKKISFPSSVQVGTGSYKRFLIVNWYTGSNNKGVTEQGSSGSPLYNADKRIVGQLYAGQSACDFMGGADFYGRVFYSWSGNNNDDGSLRPWLDPDDTGISTIDGLNYNETVGIDTPEETSERTLKVYPNPSDGMVRFDVDALGMASYKVYDLNGRCVLEGNTVLTATSQAVNLTSLSSGVYLLQLHTTSRNYSATVVIK